MRTKSSKGWLAIALGLAVVTSSGFLAAEAKPGKGNKHDNGVHKSAKFKDKFDKDDDWIKARSEWRVNNESRFTDRDRGILLDLLLGRSTHYTLDASTRRLLRDPAFTSLPPGQQQRLLSGKPLPPGIAKKVRYLPNSSIRYFGYPSYYRIGAYGDDYFLYNTKTGMVLDILTGLLRNL